MTSPCNGTCTRWCVGEQQCKDATITCPAGMACAVVCKGKQACSKVTVECPPGHACSVTCLGEQACEELNVDCGAASCTVNCDTSNGNQVCKGRRRRVRQRSVHYDVQQQLETRGEVRRFVLVHAVLTIRPASCDG